MNTKGLSRREFLVISGTAVAGASLFNLVGCAGSSAGLNVDDYTLDIGFKELNISGFRLKTRTYNGSVPGPTIETRPGRTLRVTLNNGLPPNKAWMDGEGGGGGHGHGAAKKPGLAMTPEENMNNPRNFNTTNLHVHGLDTTPHLFEPFGTSDPAANMIAIEPGESYTYNFPIPDNHPSGLDWYHPHHHGSTAVQVFNGMAGLIIVRGPIDDVPEIRAAREQIVAVQSLRMVKDKDDPTLYVMDPTPGLSPAEGGFQTNGFDLTLYTVNGEGVAWKGPVENGANTQLPVETLTVRPGEVVRFRMLNGTDEQFMPVVIDGHKLHSIAYDGRNFDAPREMEKEELAPGNRLEFLFKASMTPGTYQFKMLPVPPGVQFETNSGFVMLNINVEGEPVAMDLPTTLPLAERYYPLITEAQASRKHTAHFATVYPYDKDPSLLTGVGFEVNGKLYEHDRIDHHVTLGTAEEWTLTTPKGEGHPFHIHVNSFEVISVNGVAQPPGTFRDTVWIPGEGTVKVRMKFDEFRGKSVYHCHILIHEDTGMMQNFIIK